METFNFPYHGMPSISTEDNASSVVLKGGFRFSEEPSEPVLQLLTLTFNGMSYEFNPDGTPDALGVVNPKNNIMALWQFYKTHGTWKTFIYPHPVFGNILVKFDTPFTIPKVVGNQGKVQNVEVKLREHPS